MASRHPTRTSVEGVNGEPQRQPAALPFRDSPRQAVAEIREVPLTEPAMVTPFTAPGGMPAQSQHSNSVHGTVGGNLGRMSSGPGAHICSEFCAIAALTVRCVLPCTGSHALIRRIGQRASYSPWQPRASRRSTHNKSSACSVWPGLTASEVLGLLYLTLLQAACCSASLISSSG